MKKESTTKKSKRTIYRDYLRALLILALSFLVYVHDFEIWKGMEGFSGFSSLRIGIWVVSIFVLALSGWIFAFVNSTGKLYKFAMLVPILMISFQLAIYLFDKRNTTTNEFNTKVIVNICFAVFIVSAYFIGKAIRNNEE